MESLYFIAIIPPAKIQDEITQLKVLMAERFNSKHALKSPPHITLHMPFKWKKNKLDLLKSVIKKINDQVNPFIINLNGFAFFEPRVVYVDVVKNAELLTLQKSVVDICKKNLKLNNANYKDRPFKPHVTIGFRDLRKPDFLLAKEYFQLREFEAQFQVTEAYLMKYDGSKWNQLPYY
ncbi:MAG: 2'-5' RNA ligase family protein [Bacteroidota bacterium]